VTPRFFKTPAAFRKWLAANHVKSKELLVGFYKKGSGKPSITWPESVDEALCFGWIDGVRKRLQAQRSRLEVFLLTATWISQGNKLVDHQRQAGRDASRAARKTNRSLGTPRKN